MTRFIELNGQLVEDQRCHIKWINVEHITQISPITPSLLQLHGLSEKYEGSQCTYLSLSSGERMLVLLAPDKIFELIRGQE